jgi:hypothetical protein
MMKILHILVAVSALLAGSMSANAGIMTLGFGAITANNSANAQVGEQQLFVDVMETGHREVTFTFRNVGPTFSAITDVYFTDGPLRARTGIVDGHGVIFAGGAHPDYLPGGSSLESPFAANRALSAHAVLLPMVTGVNPGEQLGVRFRLKNGNDWQDVVDAIADGSLRIGVRATVLDGWDWSNESFVNGAKPLNNVPEPASLAILSLGAGLFAVKRRHQVR